MASRCSGDGCLLLEMGKVSICEGFPGGTSDKEAAGQCRRLWTCECDPWVGRIPWRKKWQPTPVFLLRESHGQRSLAGYRPWGHKELDTTEHLSTHTMYTQRSVGGGSVLIPDPFGGQVPKTWGIDPPWRRERRRFSFR